MAWDSDPERLEQVVPARDVARRARDDEQPHPFYVEFLRSFRDEVAAAVLAGHGAERGAELVADAVRDLSLLSPSRAEEGELAAALRDALGIVHHEHELQHGLAEAVGRALRERGEAGNLAALLARLRDAMAVHFAFEQLVMELARDPQRGAHAEAHGRLLDQLAVVQDACAARRGAAALDAFAAARAGVSDHVETLDRALDSRLRAPGAR